MSPRYPISLGLPTGRRALLDAAAAAVHTEYVESVSWKRLNAYRLEHSRHDGGIQIVAVDVGRTVQFDWTWEGATAIGAVDADRLDPAATPDQISRQLSNSPGFWTADVLEVDAARGLLFLDVTESRNPPCTGAFWVRPFEFLADLDSLYSDPRAADLQKLLPGRLHAARGAVHPLLTGAVSPIPDLRNVWRHSWGVMWGPPGTGKTTLIGHLVAGASRTGDERVLVVSTTNMATDEAAVSIGRAASDAAHLQSMVRTGRGTSLKRFRDESVEVMLEGTEVKILEQIAAVVQSARSVVDPSRRAVLNAQVQKLRQKLRNVTIEMFGNHGKSVVVTTAFMAIRALTDSDLMRMIAEGAAPFTTVVIDEAGLLSKATVAALSLLAAKRVLLVGDPLQLSPITRISRVLPSGQQEWMGSSALTHLTDPSVKADGVHLLEEQHRMHSQICDVIGKYQYGGKLRSAAGVDQRPDPRPQVLQDAPRAVWYRIDDERPGHPSIRAQRGPGGRSFMREFTPALMRRLFQMPGMAQTNGLFITPFAAQARQIADFFARERINGWQAGTVHSRQGVTVDMVIFDTVHAGSTAWSYSEWKRLVNVALSRARHFAMLIASNDEMQQPFLATLRSQLVPVGLKGDVKNGRLVPHGTPLLSAENGNDRLEAGLKTMLESPLLGEQISARKHLRPLVSQQQQQLVKLTMDGGPRLVRGVAGSGKTFVMARWLIQSAQRLREQPGARVWGVYANASLERLLLENIDQSSSHVGDDAVALAREKLDALHVGDVLSQMEREVGLPAPTDLSTRFNYNERAKAILARTPAGGFESRCAALFIDEAQDMGADTMKLLVELVKPDRPDAPALRPAHIFLDNAQNIYDRPTPRWTELGLDMRGRSTVMRESFRSTNPITEFALNFFLRLRGIGARGPDDFDDEDYKELYERELIEPVSTQHGVWWRVRFNDVDGPSPQLRMYDTAHQHDDALAQQVDVWIREQNVAPEDIVILCNRKSDCEAVAAKIRPLVVTRGFDCRVQTGRDLSRDPGVLLVTTPHSFKGYDAEIVVVAHVENYIAEDKALASNVYVAATRARSLLLMTGVTAKYAAQKRIIEVLQECLRLTDGRGILTSEQGEVDLKIALRDVVPSSQHRWLAHVVASYHVSVETIHDRSGEIVAQPIFVVRSPRGKKACFLQRPDPVTLEALHRLNIEAVVPGDALG